MRLLIFILCLGFACSASAQLDTVSLARYRGYGIELEVPATWKVMQDYSKDVKVMFVNGDTIGGDTTFENIAVTIENAPLLTLRAYFKLSKRNLNNRLLNPVFISEGEKQIAGYDSKWLIMTHRYGGRTYQAKIYYFVKRGVAYLFLFTTAPEEFDAWEPLGDRVMETLILAN